MNHLLFGGVKVYELRQPPWLDLDRWEREQRAANARAAEIASARCYLRAQGYDVRADPFTHDIKLPPMAKRHAPGTAYFAGDLAYGPGGRALFLEPNAYAMLKLTGINA